MTDDLIERLDTASIRLCSRNNMMVTGDLLSEAAAALRNASERIVELEKERKRLAVLADERAELMGELFRKQRAAEAFLAAIKSRIDVEGMARIAVLEKALKRLLMTYLDESEHGGGADDADCSICAAIREGQDALRTLILGEEGNSSSVDSSAPGYMARSDTPSPASGGEL